MSEDDTTPIERLEKLQGVSIKNAGKLLLAAILTPVVTFFDRGAAFVEAVSNLFIIPIQTFTEGIGELIISLLAGSAGVIGQSFLAAELGFTQGNVWATLGPLAPTIGVAAVLGVAALMAWYFTIPITADSIFGLFTATDLPLIGADEEE